MESSTSRQITLAEVMLAVMNKKKITKKRQPRISHVSGATRRRERQVQAKGNSRARELRHDGVCVCVCAFCPDDADYDREQELRGVLMVSAAKKKKKTHS